MVNRKEISGKGFIYVITRRLLPLSNSNDLRIRVKAWRGVFPGEEKPVIPALLAKKGDMVVDSVKDYDHLAAGDAAFNRIVKQVQDHCWK